MRNREFVFTPKIEYKLVAERSEARRGEPKLFDFSCLVPIEELNWNGILRNIREIKDLLTVVLPEAGIIPDFSTIYA